MIFFAIIKVRLNDEYNDKGETVKQLHTVDAKNENAARQKIEGYYKEKDVPYSLHHDIIELEISQHIG